MIYSTISDYNTYLRNCLVSSHFDPNLDDLLVRFSFVYESNAGFSIRQFKNNLNWFFIINGFKKLTNFGILLLISVYKADINYDTTWFTWVPPFIVQIALTNDT